MLGCVPQGHPRPGVHVQQASDLVVRLEEGHRVVRDVMVSVVLTGQGQGQEREETPTTTRLERRCQALQVRR
jgi:hypothetical protein